MSNRGADVRGLLQSTGVTCFAERRASSWVIQSSTLDAGQQIVSLARALDDTFEFGAANANADALQLVTERDDMRRRLAIVETMQRWTTVNFAAQVTETLGMLTEAAARVLNDYREAVDQAEKSGYLSKDQIERSRSLERDLWNALQATRRHFQP